MEVDSEDEGEEQVDNHGKLDNDDIPRTKNNSRSLYMALYKKSHKLVKSSLDGSLHFQAMSKN